MMLFNRSLIFSTIWFLIGLPMMGFTQGDVGTSEMEFRVKVVFPSYSIDKDSLLVAQDISDLNRFYKPEWVRDYISVEINTIHHGELRTAYSKGIDLTIEQKHNLHTLDSNTEFSVYIKYMPENNLKDNEVKDLDFKVYVNPDTDATYSKGWDALNKYLQTNVLDLIPANAVEEYNIAAINFTIDEQGKVINPHILHSTKSKEWDDIIFQAICSMEDWIPASFEDGRKVSQTFTFTVGDMRSCTINTLSIRNHVPSKI